MGGCRCSYRNCTVRTDGKSHMFHYPVFDKLRCHQWLQNAQRLEFLNLKVSQLKNRVVCEHHFTDDKFMNCMKVKLKPDAIPTEDGPYCDSSKWSANKMNHEMNKLYNISISDIDNDINSITRDEKLANFSVKYGDFLINCDIMDIMSMNQKNNGTKIDLKNPNIDLNQNNTHNYRIINDNTLSKPLLAVEPCQKNSLAISEPKVVPIEYNELQISSVDGNVHVKSNIKTTNTSLLHEKTNETSNKGKQKKISIISEQKITHPIPKIGKLQPVSPSFVLPLKIHKKEPLPSSITEISDDKVLNPHETEINEYRVGTGGCPPVTLESSKTDSPPISVKTKPKTILISQVEPPTINKVLTSKELRPETNNCKNNSTLEPSPRVATFRNRIPPERIAAIEKKRKFNMKLRDIIETCLDKLDEQDHQSEGSKFTKDTSKQAVAQQVSSFLSKDPKLPNIQELNMSYLEERMMKMENTLLKKIEQNSERIVDLKNTLVKSSVKTKSTSTQMSTNDNSYKKHLYLEISKFLSAEANSLIYEELFINKFSHNVPQCSSPKRRKYR